MTPRTRRMASASRLHRPDLRTEKRLLRNGYQRLAGLDEVGRGALAGPVTVGAVVVTADIGRVPLGLRDSKLLTPGARELLVSPIRAWAAEWAVGHASPAEIDRVGIIAGLRLAARRALAALATPIDVVLLDGNHDYVSAPAQEALFGPAPAGGNDDDPVFDMPGGPSAADHVIPEDVPAGFAVELQVKADLRCAAVAAASVLAKTTRDALMVDHGQRFPAYEWHVNKGYATANHLAALTEHGPCEWHRRSWRLPGAHSAIAGGTMGDDVGSTPAQASSRSVG